MGVQPLIPPTANPVNRPAWIAVRNAAAATAEPARNISVVSGVVGAVLTIGAAFGLSVDDDTRNAMIFLGVLLLPAFAVVGEMIRSRVTPVEKANAIAEAAYRMQPTPGEPAPKV